MCCRCAGSARLDAILKAGLSFSPKQRLSGKGPGLVQHRDIAAAFKYSTTQRKFMALHGTGVPARLPTQPALVCIAALVDLA